MISEVDGQKLVKLAREAITLSFKHKKPDLKEFSKFSKPQGVFVTLHKRGELRGCIGYPQAYYPLNEAIVKAAVTAAFDDPRFNPLEESELKQLDLEISVLTIPEKVEAEKPQDYLKKIKIGRDGLIIKNKYSSGLLLPQVAEEQEWDCKDFLENLCYKAGLNCEAWKEKDSEIYTFQAQIFCERREQNRHDSGVFSEKEGRGK